MIEGNIAFSPQDRETLDKITRARSHRRKLPITLEYLLTCWSRFVSEVEAGYGWNVYEYTNDLSSRTLLHEFAVELTQDGREKLKLVLDPLDRRFDEATNALDKPIRGEDNPNLWWKYRIPTLLLDELRNDLMSEGTLHTT